MKIKEIFTSAVNYFDELMFPEYKCFVCGREAKDLDYYMCEQCKKDFPYISGVVCCKCGHPVLDGNDYCDNCRFFNYDFDEARAVFEYNDKTKGRILGIKYHNQKYLAKFFAKLMKDVLDDWGVKPDIIVPIPISSERRKERGFNQSELIADELATLTGLPVVSKIISKKSDSKLQKGLTMKERFENMKGVFELDKRYILKFKKVLIIDDVFTTGATVSEASRTIRKAGPDRIYILTAGKRLMYREEYNI